MVSNLTEFTTKIWLILSKNMILRNLSKTTVSIADFAKLRLRCCPLGATRIMSRQDRQFALSRIKVKVSKTSTFRLTKNHQLASQPNFHTI